MKKKSIGVSAGNIHINKLANIAKNNFILKLFSILFMLVGVQLTYADNVSFQFVYGDTSIESIVFDHTTNPVYETAAGNGQLSISTSDPKQTPYQITVNTNLTKDGSNSIADLFNESLGYTTSNNNASHIIELTGAYNSHASNFDFRVGGILIINGESVPTEVYLGHTNKNHGSPNWWIGTLNGTKSSATQYAIMTVYTASGKPYCLNQDSVNYQVLVTSGVCSSQNIPEAQEGQLIFEWPRIGPSVNHVKNVTFTYNGSHDDLHNNEDYLQSVDSAFTNNNLQTYVDIYSALETSTDIANSFINLFSSTYQYTSPDSFGNSQPSELDYYIRGTLTITGDDPTNYPTLIISDFTIAVDHNKYDTFWIGTSYGLKNSDKATLRVGAGVGTYYCLHLINDSTVLASDCNI